MAGPDKMTPRATILVPAYNEEAVIARGLGLIAAGAGPGEFQVIVICNACHDRTADVARATMPEVEVIETAEPGKTNALNLGHRVARAPVRIYLDADLDVDVEDLRALIRPIEDGCARAACGGMKVDVEGCSLTS